MKHNKLTVALIALTLICTVATCLVGCANLKRAFYEPVATSPGDTNAPSLVQPRADVLAVVDGASSLAGPYGAAGAALLTALLGLGAALLNRGALKAHVSQGSTSTPDPPGK